jgi:cytochrome c-type biogenesis protein CcmH
MMRRIVAMVALAAALAHAEGSSQSAVDARMKAIADELRCLVCQNQTISDSNASLAVDLRNQIKEQVAAGKSDEEIRDYMVTRYGDFVLYRPPFKASTLVLWLGPPLLLGAGFLLFWGILRRRRAAALPPEAGKDRAAIAALLEGSGPPPRKK